MQIFYQNLKGFHWNVRGDMFFEMHKLYQEMYEWADDKIDLVAELILSLEQSPFVKFEDYLKNSTIQQVEATEPKTIAMYIISDLMMLNSCIESAHESAEESGNKTICLALTKIQTKLEKWFWMFRHYLD